MTYELIFYPQALKEWKKLNPTIQSQFKQKLTERLQHPIVSKDKLHGELSDCYKIKLRKIGYRLVYQVNQKEIHVMVIAVGKREDSKIYQTAIKRLN